MLDTNVGQEPRSGDVATTMDDLEAIPATLEHVYGRSPLTDAVCVVHGYSCEMRIDHGHLVIADGIGRHTRVRRWPKADRRAR